MKDKVVLIPFPFDDLSSVKVHPAVCLTDEIGPHGHVILAFITSRIPDLAQETDVVIKASGAHFEETGLKVSEKINIDTILSYTLELDKDILARAKAETTH